MKKGLKILVIMIATFVSVTYVKADTILNIQYGGSNYQELYYINNLRYNSVEVYEDNSDNIGPVEGIPCDSRSDCYEKAISYYQSSNYQYYVITLDINPTAESIDMNLNLFNFSNDDYYYQHIYQGGERYRFYFSDSENIAEGFRYLTIIDGASDPNPISFYQPYDYNFNFIPEGNYAFSGFYPNENDDVNNMIKISSGNPIPKIKDLVQYDSWSDYENEHLEGYTEVNLDNYEYVLLSLKDYSQTKAFQTNLQVKGQIGITPIYNYGQTSKDSITGVQVQDRCNIAYENYTSYPFYILQSDLQNNAIYAVKECSNGSSFKFDNTIFDVTYITAENKDNPTVTIGSKTYNVIPYGDLPSTATKNEENGYIPGESGSATDTGGLDSAIKNTQQKMSEIWNTFTYFTDFINQIFSVFPDEVKTILLSAFTIMIVIGLIKIFIN